MNSQLFLKYQKQFAVPGSELRCGVPNALNFDCLRLQFQEMHSTLARFSELTSNFYLTKKQPETTSRAAVEVTIINAVSGRLQGVGINIVWQCCFYLLYSKSKTFGWQIRLNIAGETVLTEWRNRFQPPVNTPKPAAGNRQASAPSVLISHVRLRRRWLISEPLAKCSITAWLEHQVFCCFRLEPESVRRKRHCFLADRTTLLNG